MRSDSPVRTNSQEQRPHSPLRPPPPPMKASAPTKSTEESKESPRIPSRRAKDSIDGSENRKNPPAKPAKPPKKATSMQIESSQIDSSRSSPKRSLKDRMAKSDTTGRRVRVDLGDVEIATATETTATDSTAATKVPFKENPEKFKGKNGIQYGLWAHYMTWGSALLCFLCGLFACIYTEASTYGCKIDGKLISSRFLFDVNGICQTTYVNPSGDVKFVCCDFDSKTDIKGDLNIGILYILYSIVLAIVENPLLGCGLYYPADNILFRNRISVLGILDMIIGLTGCTTYNTFLAGACLIANGIVYQYAAMRFEAGDGGRAKRRADAAKAKPKPRISLLLEVTDFIKWVITFNPVTFCRRIYNEDKLSSYVWVGIFVGANVIVFFYTLDVWINIVDTMKDELLDGTLNISCDDVLCKTNRKAVRYGPFSDVAPFAKACGACLNFNCSLILLPIIRILLRKLNDIGTSLSNSDTFSTLFARPVTRYIPLQKNIEFHKLCAIAVFIFSLFHMCFHMINLVTAANTTLQFFRFARWSGTDYLTGAIIVFSMFMIYSAAPDIVRMSKYEIFFKSHHFFIVFFLILFIHGPVFFYWAIIPVLLYAYERYLQTKRGSRPFVVTKVEWIAPVMAVYFKPVFKEDFKFKEGQYLYLNCPYISATEWHPFTISSASDDMHFGPRIHLETGEEVVEIPRPKSLPSTQKWHKYCLISQDWTKLDPSEYIDKSDTGYHDYISVHIKVHGLQGDQARTWTRKLKEYFELLSPTKAFPFYYTQRDMRGEVQIGRLNGPDGQQILRVDGPHSAPSEHYTNYGTVMIIGAGIGLTPCASILCALTKYRWKKNYNPELLYFYWVVRQNEVESFQWLVHMLTELSFELKKGTYNNQIDNKYYCQVNIYVTGVDKDSKYEGPPLFRPKKNYNTETIQQSFTAEELYG